MQEMQGIEAKQKTSKQQNDDKKNWLARIVFSLSSRNVFARIYISRGWADKSVPIGAEPTRTLVYIRNVPRKYEGPSSCFRCERKQKTQKNEREQRRSRNKSLLLFGLSLDGAHTFQFHFISQ